MSIADELEAVERIMTLLKRYRYQTRDDQDLATSRVVDAYLKRHLGPSDYRFWQFLQADGQFIRSPVVDSTLKNGLSFEQFKRLLSRYQRVVYVSPLSTRSHAADWEP